MGNIIKKSFKISQWTPVDDTEFRYEGETRNAKRIIIGTMQQPGGTEQYVLEAIYSDLVDMIQSKKVTAHVDIFAEPPIVLEMNGRLVPHNAEITVLKEETEDMLNNHSTTISNQIRALIELRNNAYSQEVLGKAIKQLRVILSDGLASPLNYDFIKLILEEKYSNYLLENESDLSKELRTYTKEELISVYGGLIEKKESGACRIEPMKSMVEDGIDEKTIERALKNEISRRYFTGEIR